jgi:hypothetical protein
MRLLTAVPFFVFYHCSNELIRRLKAAGFVEQRRGKGSPGRLRRSEYRDGSEAGFSECTRSPLRRIGNARPSEPLGGGLGTGGDAHRLDVTRNGS